MNGISIDFLQAELNRVHTLIEFTNKKASFLAAPYLGSLGFVVGQQDVILSTLFVLDAASLGVYVVAICTFIVLSARGFYFLFSAISPNFTALNEGGSLLYYGSVARRPLAEYLDELERLSEKQIKEEIAEQIYTNSVIAHTKMMCVGNATRTLFGVIGAVLVIILVT